MCNLPQGQMFVTALQQARQWSADSETGISQATLCPPHQLLQLVCSPCLVWKLRAGDMMGITKRVKWCETGGINIKGSLGRKPPMRCLYRKKYPVHIRYALKYLKHSRKAGEHQYVPIPYPICR